MARMTILMNDKSCFQEIEPSNGGVLVDLNQCSCFLPPTFIASGIFRLGLSVQANCSVHSLLEPRMLMMFPDETVSNVEIIFFEESNISAPILPQNSPNVGTTKDVSTLVWIIAGILGGTFLVFFLPLIILFVCHKRCQKQANPTAKTLLNDGLLAPPTSALASGDTETPSKLAEKNARESVQPTCENS
uniref:Uncharacterized protein n=1 Tax=Panagrolaimus sp. JU765 TaxID=591449 RepID=A0AC34QS22_9BILA